MAWLRGQPLPVSPLPAAGPGVFSTAAWTAPWPHPGQPQPRPRQGQLLRGRGPGPQQRKPSQRNPSHATLHSPTAVSSGNRTVSQPRENTEHGMGKVTFRNMYNTARGAGWVSEPHGGGARSVLSDRCLSTANRHSRQDLQSQRPAQHMLRSSRGHYHLVSGSPGAHPALTPTLQMRTVRGVGVC